MIDQLNQWDTALFLFLNGKHNAFWDVVMYWLSDKWIWIPLYVFFIYLMIRYYKSKAVWVILTIFAVIGLSDFISVNLFKNVFMRLRPCHEPSLNGMVHLVNNYCGGEYGFYSSHASNHFAIATIVSLFIRNHVNRIWIIALFMWAGAISYSRIYLGVHYPGDVIAGALAGTAIAYLIYKLTLKFKPVLDQWP